jgi:tRNA (guanine37-N1)-methyltransferase
VNVHVVTIFPELINGYAQAGLLRRAIETQTLQMATINPRDFTNDVHRSVDDAPFGGGAGMLMKPQPLVDAVRSVADSSRVVLMAPHGRPFDQSVAKEYAKEGRDLTFICGRYEGVDARLETLIVDDVLSIGDFVLAGGELAALCVIEAVIRLRPGVLGNQASTEEESFESGIVEYEQFTRPALFEGLAVPEVLLGGNHAEIAKWRRRSSLLRTARYRPDLLRRCTMSEEDAAFLDESGYSYLVNSLSGSSDDARN